jgi:hypothetical protein
MKISKFYTENEYIKFTIIFTSEKAVNNKNNPVRAYIPVVFAFLIFSSSPYDVVYCIPEYTIAPIANRAPNASTFSAILTTNSLIRVSASQPATGSIALLGLFAHSLSHSAAFPDAVGSHDADTYDEKMKNPIKGISIKTMKLFSSRI